MTVVLDGAALDAAALGLGPRDASFLGRIFGDGLGKYRRRLESIGFANGNEVLDAGCGFGQWTFALAETCRRVIGVDNDAKRIAVARKLSAGMGNVEFQVASLTSMPFADERFDLVFCYSAIYYTDVEQSVREIARVLKPGGRVYLCSNGVGWYAYNIIKRPNPASDFSPLAYGLRALWDTLRYRVFRAAPGPGGSVATSRRYLSALLERYGIAVNASGMEGTVVASPGTQSQPFFRGRYLGLECVSEWLGTKRRH